MRANGLLVIVFIIAGSQALAAPIDAQSINQDQFDPKAVKAGTVTASMVKLQIALDRAHFSPGEIDGKAGENVEKALAAYREVRGLSSADVAEVWSSLANTFTDAPAIVEYQISAGDLKGPFVSKIPQKMEEQKDLRHLSYTSPKEELAERFHMSVELLSALNPGKQFDKAGETIQVAKVSNGLNQKADRLQVDKTKQTLTIFGKDGAILGVFPVTAGSTDKPAPSGTLTITAISKNPTYHYNPEYGFKGVKSERPFTIKAGPNNPVGAVWIGLNREGYGLHGTPDPSKVSKAESHGCIRLTNWDVLQLAAVVKKGVPVEFTGDENQRDVTRAQGSSRRNKHR